MGMISSPVSKYITFFLVKNIDTMLLGRETFSEVVVTSSFRNNLLTSLTGLW